MGGAEITQCDCLEYSDNPEPKMEPGESGGVETNNGHTEGEEAKMGDTYYHGDRYGMWKLDNLAEQYQKGRERERDIDKWEEWGNELDESFSEDDEEENEC